MGPRHPEPHRQDPAGLHCDLTNWTGLCGGGGGARGGEGGGKGRGRGQPPGPSQSGKSSRAASSARREAGVVPGWPGGSPRAL